MLQLISKCYCGIVWIRLIQLPLGVIVLNYRDYQNVRDAAWRILLDCGITRLPVDLNWVCRQLEVRHISYARYWAELPEIADQTDGMTFYKNGEPIILYDNRKSPNRVRFTVAHELGHLILGHVKTNQTEALRRGTAYQNNRMETEANQFAMRLLAPACVLWGLDLHNAEEIMEVCHISYQAARIRARRMTLLYKRGKFLVSPLERELYQRFQGFITEGRLSGHPQ